jgi:hypothetical protein
MGGNLLPESPADRLRFRKRLVLDQPMLVLGLIASPRVPVDPTRASVPNVWQSTTVSLVSLGVHEEVGNSEDYVSVYQEDSVRT